MSIKLRRTMPGSKTPYRGTITALLILIILSGCGYTGSRGLMRFDSLRYPASMSSYLYGPHDELLARGSELQVINRFNEDYDYWGTAYSLGQLTYPRDVGEDINRAIEASGGDGIVNVKITAKTGVMAHVPFFSFFPLWPSQTRVAIEGDIVKYKPSTTYGLLRVEEVLIIVDADDATNNRLNERCRSVGSEETLFAVFAPPSCTWRGFVFLEHLWKTMSPAGEEKQFPHMINSVKMKTKEKGANTAQIVRFTYKPDEVMKIHKETASAPPVSDFSNSAALHVRYWLCPTHVQEASARSENQ